MDFVTNFFNVELAVQGDLDKLSKTRESIEKIKAEETQNKVIRADEYNAITAEIAQLREENKVSCQPMLERADELSLAGIFFKQIADSVRDSYNYVQNLMKSETEQYGYVSKNVLSLTLSLESLKSAMASGKPFHHELKIFKENIGDIDQELSVWADVLQHFAFKGLPQQPDAYASAVRLAHAIQEVELYRVADADQPKSFLDFLKFSSTRFIPAFRPEVYDDYASVILDSTRAHDYDTALRSADKAAKIFEMEKLNKNPLDPSAWSVEHGKIAYTRVPPAAAYYQFRECISGIVVAQQFRRYCQAALTMQQYRVTEPFLH